MQDILYIITRTGAEYQSDVVFRNDTPYLALTGKLWVTFVNICESITVSKLKHLDDDLNSQNASLVATKGWHSVLLRGLLCCIIQHSDSFIIKWHFQLPCVKVEYQDAPWRIELFKLLTASQTGTRKISETSFYTNSLKGGFLSLHFVTPYFEHLWWLSG